MDDYELQSLENNVEKKVGEVIGRKEIRGKKSETAQNFLRLSTSTF